MCSCRQDPCATDPPLLQQVVRATGNRDDETVTLPAGHNRWAVHVRPVSTVTAGAVEVQLGVRDPATPSTWSFAKAGSVAYSATGGRTDGTMAPIEHQLKVAITGYVGAGELVVLAESWREP